MAKIPDWALEAAREIDLQLPVDGVLDKGIIETLGVGEAVGMFEQRIAKIISRHAREAEINSPAMKALVSLTPGGSEFVDDPERCVAVVRATRDSQHRVIVQFKMRMDAALEVNKQLVAALQWIASSGSKSIEQCRQRAEAALAVAKGKEG